MSATTIEDDPTRIRGEYNMAMAAYRECNAELRKAQAELAALRVEMGRQAERLGAAQARVIELEANAAAAGRRADESTGERRVRLSRVVRGDGPFASVVAPSGDYRTAVNKHGAVSVVLSDGTLLGVKPGEFEWLP